MSDDSRRSGASVAALRSSDDRKSPSSTSSAASPAAVLAAPVALAPDPKITLKSADMKEEMRQEAFDCARAVIILLFMQFFYELFFVYFASYSVI